MIENVKNSKINGGTDVRYTTVLFDADETLLDFHRSETEAISDTLTAFSLECDDEVIRDYSEINASLWRMLEKGLIDKTTLRVERFRRFCEYRGYSCDAKAMARAYESALAQKSYLKDGAYELCQRLSQRCTLYIVTNGIKEIQTGRFAKTGLAPFFKDVFISEDIGYEKPDINYFLQVERRLGGIDKGTTVIVGDSLTSDMKGGISYGIDTCFLNPSQKSIPDGIRVTYNVPSLDGVERIILYGENYDRP